METRSRDLPIAPDDIANAATHHPLVTQTCEAGDQPICQSLKVTFIITDAPHGDSDADDNVAGIEHHGATSPTPPHHVDAGVETRLDIEFVIQPTPAPQDDKGRLNAVYTPGDVAMAPRVLAEGIVEGVGDRIEHRRDAVRGSTQRRG